jgi:hypothetical protein
MESSQKMDAKTGPLESVQMQDRYKTRELTVDNSDV